MYSRLGESVQYWLGESVQYRLGESVQQADCSYEWLVQRGNYENKRRVSKKSRIMTSLVGGCAPIG